MKLALALLAVVPVVAAGALGCGTSSSGETAEYRDRDAARAGNAAVAYVHALAEGDGDRACRLLTPNAMRELRTLASKEVSRLNTASCPKVISFLPERLPPSELKPLKEAKVDDVRVHGDVARVTFKRADRDEPIELKRSGDDWRVSGNFLSE